MLPFAPLRYVDGYLPIEDFGLIGDLTTAALVGRDGTVAWLPLPAFDGAPLFCSLLDHRRGGAFTVAPEELEASRQFYLEDTGVLVTEMRGAGGTVRVTDAMALRAGADLSEGMAAGRDELLRFVEVTEGAVRLRVALEPRGGAHAERMSGGLYLHVEERSDLDLHLASDRPLEGLVSTLELRAGEGLELRLTWGRPPQRYRANAPKAALEATVAAWRRWLDRFQYEGPQGPLVRRSAITLKLLDYAATGAIVAAPTSSLPETLGGERNWDYRYTWVRDAAFSVYALHRIGFSAEARGFLGWVLDAVEREGRPRVLYTLRGTQPPPERTDEGLEGYRDSRPVRWGNGAAEQVQNDVYGEILDCAYQWARGGGEIDADLWGELLPLIEAARTKWRQPDQGIWEVRTSGRVFTYSAAMCQVALDRGARLAQSLGLPGDAAAWRREAEVIRRAILEEAWDDRTGSLTEHLGGGHLDASLLALPLRRVIPADHPKMVATTRAITEHLGAGDGLLYRYLTDKYPDGLAGHEGAFLLCSFWLVDNLAYQGRVEEATELYDALCARANPLGLLPEQIDPDTGTFLGNYPQAFSHIGVISSGFNLSRRGEEGS